MLRELQFPPGALHDPGRGTKNLWRQGRPWVANRHAEWGGVGPGWPRREGRGTRVERGWEGAESWKLDGVSEVSECAGASGDRCVPLRLHPGDNCPPSTHTPGWRAVPGVHRVCAERASLPSPSGQSRQWRPRLQPGAYTIALLGGRGVPVPAREGCRRLPRPREPARLWEAG